MNPAITEFRLRAASLIRIPAVRWSAGIGLIALTVLLLNPEEVFASLGDARWEFVLPIGLGLAAIHMINALSWRSITGIATGLKILPERALRLYYASLIIGILTPSNIGSDIYRMKAVSTDEVRWQSLVSPIALQRATSFLSLGVIGLVGSLLLPVSSEIKLGVLGLIAILAGLLGASVWLSRQSPDWLNRLLRFLGTQDSNADRRHAGRLGSMLSIGMLSGLAFHGAAIALTLGLVAAIDVEMSPMSALAAIAIMRTAILVPFSVNGLGVQESAAALIFPAAGMPAETGVAISLLSRIGLLVTLGIGSMSLARTSTLNRHVHAGSVT